MSETPAALRPDAARRDAAIALAAAPVLLVAWRYHGTPSGWSSAFGDGAGPASGDLLAHLWPFAAMFLLGFLVPAGILFLSRRPLSSVGLALPADRRTARFVALLAPIVVIPVAWIASRMPEVRAEYPLFRGLFDRHDLVLPYEAAYALLYYVGWEFCFRGWLLFTVEAAHGALVAILVQTMASCLLHIGKPEGEILLSIPGGIVLGWVALRTRSVLLTWFPHMLLGVSTDLFVLAS